MRRYMHSVGFAVQGLLHALRTERNFRLFVLCYIVSLVLALLLQVDPADFPIILLSGGVFLSIELLNTALERFADAFDTHTKKQNDIHRQAIKATKDVAAGAALVGALVWALTLFIVYWPHVLLLAPSYGVNVPAL